MTVVSTELCGLSRHAQDSSNTELFQRTGAHNATNGTPFGARSIDDRNAKWVCGSGAHPAQRTANCMTIASYPIENHSEQGQFAELPLKSNGNRVNFAKRKLNPKKLNTAYLTKQTLR